jgi:uncharacterized membrane protein
MEASCSIEDDQPYKSVIFPQFSEQTWGFPIMNKLLQSGRYLFALAMIAFGIQQFIIGRFIMTRVTTAFGGTPIAYLTGAVLIGAGILIVIQKNVKWAVNSIAIIILFWAVIPHIPGVLADRNLGGEWTNFFKALSLLAGSFLLLDFRGELPAGKPIAVVATRIILGVFLIICGIQHFLFVDFVNTLVPAWIPPNPTFWTYFAGAALLAGGVGLLIPQTAQVAATLSGVMILTWFFILHIPRAIADPTNAGEWTGCCESLALSGILFVLASKLKK